MFDALGKYRCVIVTGPQRSGATLCAHAVAYDSGLRYVDEEDYGCDLDAWREIVATGKGVVVHSPAMSRWVHEVADRGDVFVIWMIRTTSQVMLSESRIDWKDKEEKAKYRGVGAYVGKYPISGVKLKYWREVQRGLVRHWREVHYDELKAHPLWLPRERRRNFGPRQWALDGVAMEVEA